MSLSPEGKEIVQERIEEHVETAESFVGESPESAARNYLKAAKCHERLAQNADRDARAELHRRKAAELESNAEAQVSPEQPRAPAERSGSTGDSGAGPGSNTSDSPRSPLDGAEGTDDTDSAEYFGRVPDVSLSDVGGLDDECERVRDAIIKPQLHPELYEEMGVNMSNGVLLHGPPGTGKSMLARAVANALDRPYAELSAAELGSEYVNKGAQNIAQLFEEARTHQPCVLFIDELDSLARSRADGPEQTDGSRQMITQLLQELDQIQGSDICVIGATNLVEEIDGAIKRSGRFDRKVQVGAPDANDRREILALHLEDKLTDGSLDLDALAERTAGFSGADLATAVKRAGRASVGEDIDEGRTEPAQLRPITYGTLLREVREMEPGITEWKRENGLA